MRVKTFFSVRHRPLSLHIDPTQAHAVSGDQARYLSVSRGGVDPDGLAPSLCLAATALTRRRGWARRRAELLGPGVRLCRASVQHSDHDDEVKSTRGAPDLPSLRLLRSQSEKQDDECSPVENEVANPTASIMEAR